MNGLWATIFLAACFWVAYRLGYQNGKHDAFVATKFGYGPENK